MVDTNTIHVFIIDRLTDWLDLHILKLSNQVKVVNTSMWVVVGFLYYIPIHIGYWSKRHVMVVLLDDLNVILGINFL